MATGVVEAIYKLYLIFFVYEKKIRGKSKEHKILSWTERGKPVEPRHLCHCSQHVTPELVPH